MAELLLLRDFEEREKERKRPELSNSQRQTDRPLCSRPKEQSVGFCACFCVRKCLVITALGSGPPNCKLATPLSPIPTWAVATLIALNDHRPFLPTTQSCLAILYRVMVDGARFLWASWIENPSLADQSHERVDGQLTRSGLWLWAPLIPSSPIDSPGVKFTPQRTNMIIIQFAQPGGFDCLAIMTRQKWDWLLKAPVAHSILFSSFNRRLSDGGIYGDDRAPPIE